MPPFSPRLILRPASKRGARSWLGKHCVRPNVLSLPKRLSRQSLGRPCPDHQGPSRLPPLPSRRPPVHAPARTSCAQCPQQQAGGQSCCRRFLWLIGLERAKALWGSSARQRRSLLPMACFLRRASDLNVCAFDVCAFGWPRARSPAALCCPRRLGDCRERGDARVWAIRTWPAA